METTQGSVGQLSPLIIRLRLSEDELSNWVPIPQTSMTCDIRGTQEEICGYPVAAEGSVKHGSMSQLGDDAKTPPTLGLVVHVFQLGNAALTTLVRHG